MNGRPSHAAVQQAAKALFLGVAPERQAELESLWSRYGPSFELLADNGRDGRFVLEAGLFKFVRFNHRAMRAFWLASFIAWAGYESVHATTITGTANFQRFNKMIDSFLAMIAADDPATVPMPDGIPEPGVFLKAALAPAARAAAELATIATGWALLHELRHIQLQQEGCSPGPYASAAECHAEEMACDAYATAFLLDRAGDYAAAHGAKPEQVYQKRQIAIYFAFAGMALISAEDSSASQSHPPLQARIDRVAGQMEPFRTDAGDVVAMAAFEALRVRWSQVPRPINVERLGRPGADGE